MLILVGIADHIKGLEQLTRVVRMAISANTLVAQFLPGRHLSVTELSHSPGNVKARKVGVTNRPSSDGPPSSSYFLAGGVPVAWQTFS
jgi:hypothetical protein